jgi:hypothetical protein
MSNAAMSQWRNQAASRFYAISLCLCCICLLLAAGGCASSDPADAASRRPFNFKTDTFAFPNELVWEYGYDEHGKWSSHPREPAPEYSHHCFVVARSAKQFFEHARFDTNFPVADTNTYRKLIRKVVASDSAEFPPESKKIVIPGYPDLHTFSAAQAPLLKAECGGAWQSYFQRGHWRIMMPFTRGFEEEMAEKLVADLKDNRPPVVHVINFPSLNINHALLLFGFEESDKEIRFATYDPNDPVNPTTLTYDRAARTFQLPYNAYFPGGNVDIYEVYCSWYY